MVFSFVGSVRDITLPNVISKYIYSLLNTRITSVGKNESYRYKVLEKEKREGSKERRNCQIIKSKK